MFFENILVAATLSFAILFVYALLAPDASLQQANFTFSLGPKISIDDSVDSDQPGTQRCLSNEPVDARQFRPPFRRFEPNRSLRSGPASKAGSHSRKVNCLKS